MSFYKNDDFVRLATENKKTGNEERQARKKQNSNSVTYDRMGLTANLRRIRTVYLSFSKSPCHQAWLASWRPYG